MANAVSIARSARTDRRGQATVELAVVLIPFLFLLFGVVDVGRAIYAYNGVAEAAREIARATIVHPYDTCCALGTSTQAQAAIAQQKRVVPGLSDSGITITCVDLNDQAVAGTCPPGDYVKVAVGVAWSPASPLLLFLGVHDLTSVSRMQLQ